MGGAANKTAAIRAVIARRGRPMTIEDLHPLLENKIKLVYGRHKLYTLLGLMQIDGDLVTAGRANKRTYDLTAKGRRMHARQR